MFRGLDIKTAHKATLPRHRAAFPAGYPPLPSAVSLRNGQRNGWNGARSNGRRRAESGRLFLHPGLVMG